MAYDGKVNYEDVFSQVRMWDTIIYNYLKKKNIVIPPKEKTDKNWAGATIHGVAMFDGWVMVD